MGHWQLTSWSQLGSNVTSFAELISDVITAQCEKSNRHDSVAKVTSAYRAGLANKIFGD